MYLIPIIVPIYVETKAGGDRRHLVATDWKRALFLLRDSLEGRYGDLVVVAPALPADGASAGEQRLEPIDPEDGVRLEPTFDGEARARNFWMRELPPLRATLAPLVAGARVVHGTLDDLYRPMTQMAFWMSIRAGRPTLFVQDVDQVVQVRDRAEGPRARLQAAAFAALYERVCRASVARADLSLLKGKALMKRYGRSARNPREFHDTSYFLSEVAPEEVVEARLVSLGRGRPLRLVYCGRLVGLKGVTDSIAAVAAARRQGADVTFDIIGAGPEADALQAQIDREGLRAVVTLTGARPYDGALLRHLATFDALLFTPRVAETPRMIFDGYAAGLPLVAAEIPYVRERADEEGAAIVFPRGDVAAAAAALVGLARAPQGLVSLSRAARAAGLYHAADAWYRRRADWTHEAVARHGR